jgi:AAA family ATP:ADP antiporter
MKLCKFNFGEFEEQEFRKFIKLGFILFILVGIYWTAKSLRDANFIQLVGGSHLPYAKIVSAFLTFLLVGFYTNLIGAYSKEKIFAQMPLFYGITIFVLGFIIFLCQDHIYTNPVGIIIVNYIWFFFLDSWGILMLSCFWGVVSDTTDPKSASKGIPLISCISQCGGIILPYPIVSLPHKLGLKTDLISIIVTGCLILASTAIIKNFFKTTPKELLEGFKSEDNSQKKEPKQSSKWLIFVEGIKLLCVHKYLACIFIFGFTIEFLLSIFDFSFKLKTAEIYSGVELSHYLGIYASSVNAIIVILLLLGISNIPRFFGIKVTLILILVFLGGGLLSFLICDSLTMLFALISGGKTIRLALSNPTLKQLYIPTSKLARFKAQAWIDTFESRFSKSAGSLFNMLLNPLQMVYGAAAGTEYYLLLTGVIGFPMIAVLIGVAVYLGKTYQKAIDEKRSLC